jgi:hypothetical protein
MEASSQPSSRMVNIIAMLQQDKQELQSRVEALSKQLAPSATRLRDRKELELLQAKVDEGLTARSALSAEVQVSGAACAAGQPCH